MKRKFSLICTFVLVLSVCATVTLTSFTDARQSDVSYASVEQYYNGNDEVADMNTTTERNPVDDYLGDKVETTASGGLLDGIGGGGFDIDIGIGDIFSDAKDVIGSIVGGNDSSSSSSGGSSSSGNNVVYIDPVPAGTQSYQSSDVNNAETQSQTQAQPSESASVNETVSGSVAENSNIAPETHTIVTAPETIGTDDGGDEDDNSRLGVIIAIIAAIWCIAIIAVIVLFLMKKKRAERKAESEKELEFTYGAKKADTDTGNTSDMSLSDLFEEANKD